MSPPADPQRSRCYEAEKAAVKRVPLRGFMPPLVHVQDYVNDVVRSEWWAEHVTYLAPVLVRKSRLARHAASGGFLPEFQGGQMWRRHQLWIELPEWISRHVAWTDWVVLHELAHLGRCTSRGILPQGEAVHGPEWAGLFLALVREFMGEDAAGALRDEFRAKRVRHVPSEPARGCQLATPSS